MLRAASRRRGAEQMTLRDAHGEGHQLRCTTAADATDGKAVPCARCTGQRSSVSVSKSHALAALKCSCKVAVLCPQPCSSRETLQAEATTWSCRNSSTRHSFERASRNRESTRAQHEHELCQRCAGLLASKDKAYRRASLACHDLAPC